MLVDKKSIEPFTEPLCFLISLFYCLSLSLTLALTAGWFFLTSCVAHNFVLKMFRGFWQVHRFIYWHSAITDLNSWVFPFAVIGRYFSYRMSNKGSEHAKYDRCGVQVNWHYSVGTAKIASSKLSHTKTYESQFIHRLSSLSTQSLDINPHHDHFTFILSSPLFPSPLPLPNT